MAITESQVTIWASQLQIALRKDLVFAGPQAVNRNYEGDIQQKGDSVRIISISDPTIAAYTEGSTTITPEDLTDAERTLNIDQANYFAFQLGDISKAQSANGGALMSEAANRAAYGLADVADQYVAGLYTGADSANKIGTTAITSSDLAVQYLVQLKVVLDNANVPKQGRYCIIPPWYHGLLLRTSVFNSLANSGTTEALDNGLIGRAFGFDMFESNNVINVTGDDYLVSAGYTGAITFAQQINKVEAYRPQDSFSDALKGLNLFGAKLARPTGIATLTASIT
jgi:autotransporter adhesin